MIDVDKNRFNSSSHRVCSTSWIGLWAELALRPTTIHSLKYHIESLGVGGRKLNKK
jgi:hypothetical protein